MNRYDAGMRLLMEARELREEANRLERRGARVKGDAERKHDMVREHNDQRIQVGSRVHYAMFQRDGTVVRVNKKTYTIQFDHGAKYAIDKMFVKPLDNDTLA